MKRDLAIVFERLLRLAEAHPGLPVVVLAPSGGEAHIGMMNFYPTEDDWFFAPVPIDEMELDRSEGAED